MNGLELITSVLTDVSTHAGHTLTGQRGAKSPGLQLQEAQMDWVTLKALRKTRSSAKVPDSEEDNNELSAMLAATPSAPREERKYRHQRLLQKQVQEVHSSAKKLTSSQARLQHQVHRLEKQVKTLLHSNSAGPDDGAATRELRERVSNLESSSRLSARSLFNMSRQLVALDKLHLSLLQLLESVESLENKVDRGLPDLQREISKMEFGRAQITSTSALLKEEVENQRASVKALSVGVSALQEKTDKDHSRLTEVQEQLSNLSSSLQVRDYLLSPSSVLDVGHFVIENVLGPTNYQ
uniref:Uncharacterized protein n=1 Tax=Timema cristinae TaxID=61476 RepID=A0A7R9HC29_TIMCR|nr:unnamed protein product [Timema cristinae]